MKIQSLSLQYFSVQLNTGSPREGVWIRILDQDRNAGWGEISPLPSFSKETLVESIKQIELNKELITQVDWTARNCLEELAKLKLYPSTSFGLESAILSIIQPIGHFQMDVSALLMGSIDDIREQAKQRYDEGYKSAKLKVRDLSFEEAAQIIHELKDKFKLRIDVNRTWNTEDSLTFFSQFPLDTFDYVEEPFQNPKDLHQFPHPLAIDESYRELSFKEMESLSTLKALIYKPTVQGGYLGCQPIKEWADERGVSIVISSSFESELGLKYVASVAHRLALTSPIGIGTYHYLKNPRLTESIQFSKGVVYIADDILRSKL